MIQRRFESLGAVQAPLNYSVVRLSLARNVPCPVSHAVMTQRRFESLGAVQGPKNWWVVIRLSFSINVP